MPTVSLSFLLTIGAVAAGSAVLHRLSPNPVFGMTALILALYAVHGLGLRLLAREQGDPREIRREYEDLQSEMEKEKADLEAELAEHRAVEREWIGLTSSQGRSEARPLT